MSAMKYDDIPLLVTETVWPSKGDENEIEASVENAAAYNGNLVKHILTGTSIPLRLKVDLTIEARGLPLTSESLASLPPFNAGESNVKKCKPEVAKTGLGSSAAMTTAVVAALRNYLGVVDLSHCNLDQKSEHLDFVHMIAQTAHYVVGNGFDVSSLLGESGSGGSSTPSMVGAVKKWRRS
ncbi:hypothetical protein L6452_27460 [Arctium lappa]|uniref:Uncharacterized protein n=1 Tax=Arctium lappa TaxID=4217 RepID=A0ACB8ZWL3_ARCLA|nr:hypothetical protein L6452_27460 [Arctium lappa]